MYLFKSIQYVFGKTTTKERLMHVYIFFVIYILFASVISTSIHHCVNNSSDIKVPMKVITTETLALHQNKFI